MEQCCSKLPLDVVRHIFDLAYDELSIDARIAFQVPRRKLDQCRLSAAAEMFSSSKQTGFRAWYDSDGLFYHRMRTINGVGTFKWRRCSNGTWKLVEQPKGLTLATYEMWSAFAWSDPHLFDRLYQRYQTIRVYLTHSLADRINKRDGHVHLAKRILSEEFRHIFKSSQAFRAWDHISMDICCDLYSAPKDNVGTRFTGIMQRLFDNFRAI